MGTGRCVGVLGVDAGEGSVRYDVFNAQRAKRGGLEILEGGLRQLDVDAVESEGVAHNIVQLGWLGGERGRGRRWQSWERAGKLGGQSVGAYEVDRGVAVDEVAGTMALGISVALRMGRVHCGDGGGGVVEGRSG